MIEFKLFNAPLFGGMVGGNTIGNEKKIKEFF